MILVSFPLASKVISFWENPSVSNLLWNCRYNIFCFNFCKSFSCSACDCSVISVIVPFFIFPCNVAHFPFVLLYFISKLPVTLDIAFKLLLLMLYLFFKSSWCLFRKSLLENSFCSNSFFICSWFCTCFSNCCFNALLSWANWLFWSCCCLFCDRFCWFPNKLFWSCSICCCRCENKSWWLDCVFGCEELCILFCWWVFFWDSSDTKWIIIGPRETIRSPFSL